LGPNIAQINRQISTTGVEFMDPALEALIVALTSIRDQADSVSQKDRQVETGKVPCLAVQRLWARKALHFSLI
jgi:hypothetical protein